jgi:phosphatidylserine/phosphatidylglycerophosphate/cardiolipin synthase-like enzyme
VPGKDGVSVDAQLVGQGVHIRILTNSLASTDSPLVHDGYARYRVALLKLGVELVARCGRSSARSAPRFIRSAAPTPACTPRPW